MDLSKRITNEEAKTRTIWYDIDDASFCIRELTRIPKALNLLRNSQGKINKTGKSLSYEEDTRMTLKIVKDHILVDWAGLYNDGEEFPYSQENAHWLLTNYDPILNELFNASLEPTNFEQQIEKEADEKKN